MAISSKKSPYFEWKKEITILTGGYDYAMFVDSNSSSNLDSLQCPICLLVLKEPNLLSCCGVHICQVCINRIQEKYQTCPCCREPSFTSMLDKKTRGMVLGLKVRCEMSEVGCAWIGELGDLPRHLEQQCLYTENECQHGCGERYPRHLLQIHEKDECPKRSTDAKLEALSIQMMTKFSNMEKEIASLRKQYNDDIAKLQFECEELKENNEQHQNDNKHLLQQLQFTCRELKEAKQKKKQQSILMPQWMLPIMSISTYLFIPCVLSMTGFSWYKKENKIWFSPPFYTRPGGYKLCLGIHANGVDPTVGNYVSSVIHLMQGENDNTLKWPFRGFIKIQLLNWSRDYGHKVDTINLHSKINARACARVLDKDISDTGYGNTRFIHHSDLVHDSDTDANYLFNDSLCFNVVEAVVLSV